jgi:hypothetical protein
MADDRVAISPGALLALVVAGRFALTLSERMGEGYKLDTESPRTPPLLQAVLEAENALGLPPLPGMGG